MSNFSDVVNVETGNLYVVNRGFWTSGEKTFCDRKVKARFSKGDIIEIRYPYQWHFRDEQDQYHHVKECAINKNCSFYGRIHEDVRFGNKHKLNQILKDGLYYKISDFKLVLK